MQRIDVPGTERQAADYAGLIGNRLGQLPFSLRVLAENAARHSDGGAAASDVADRDGATVPFRPARLLLQDMLGLPLLVDIMALRTRLAEDGGDPTRIDMSLPVDLVIDHAMTINHWAEKLALQKNMAREFEVNHERFAFLKACEARFANLRVIPPGGGIMHQVNLEYLGKTVLPDHRDEALLVADTNLGTDSHTPMINGLGVLGWGIGGLEAEAIMFGEATPLNVPKVVGLEVTGTPSDRITATDIALTVAEVLRQEGVVDRFVELFGSGYGTLSVADRATIANMSPEYGSTCVFCPVDANTIRYLRETGRTARHVRQVEAYCRTQQMWAGDQQVSPDYDTVLHLDLSRIGRTVAGPAKPEQRIDLGHATETLAGNGAGRRVPVPRTDFDLGDGDVIIAAITSCTNTANPRNMILAGLMARNAIARGLTVKPHVKTSLAPGSRVVARYLEKSGLQGSLDALGFQVAAFSCSTCNGMSGPLAPEIEATIKDHGICGVAVLSGNRNFAGRIHPLAAQNLLASPPLVVAYALAGTLRTDIANQPLGADANGRPVMLEDLWPAQEEVDHIVEAHLAPDDFLTNYRAIGTVNENWNALETDTGTFGWPPSTYVSFPPFVRDIPAKAVALPRLKGLRPLVILGDSVTTDHISPSGAIVPHSDAGKFLIANGTQPVDFNSYGTRRGCADIVVRSTFANVRLANEMTPDREGPWTRLEPEGQVVSVFEAIEAYRNRDQPLLVIGGRDYGCGSSRDTAAKAPWLAGIRAVIAESFERIHRSNLVNMGLAPLCFPTGITRRSLALDGTETYDIALSDDLREAQLTIHRRNGGEDRVPLDLRLYNDAERETFRAGGLLPRVYRAASGIVH